MPVYWFILFLMPKIVERQFDCLRKHFFWRVNISNNKEKPKLHLLSWENVCKPIGCGGLGLTSLSDRNSTFLFKWWWKCCAERWKLWNTFLQHKYGNDFIITRFLSLINDNASSFILKSIIESGMSSIERGFFSHVFGG